ncbi:MAG: DUF255 domain-containing protein [Planctomycetes bacterium]|nr:DUF255 domain-containing protein [Planctomycetota bacterium]
MSIRTMLAAATLAAVLGAVAIGADTPKAAHPYFNDGGTLIWSTKLADAQTAAKASDKLIFVEMGRKACGNCKAVCETVLPDPSIKDRLAKLCVGLAAEADPPARDQEIAALLTKNLPGAGTLPFVGFVTTDLQWVAGFSGFKQAGEFAAILEQAEKSPLLNASPENAKKLDGIAAAAAQGVEKQQWAKVLAAGKDAEKLKGRSPAREKIDASLAAAHAYAEGELAKALELAATDAAAARVALKKLAPVFAGEPEGKDAETGVKALERVAVIAAVPADKQDAAREKATKDFGATRWVALFAKPAEK